MDFDLAKLDTLSLSDEGVPMPVVHPRTKEPVKNEDGSVVTITLCGRNSDVARSSMRRLAEKATERAARGMVSSFDDREHADTEFLADCTRGWTFTKLDGEPFPFTRSNAMKLWGDQRFRWLRERGLSFVHDDGNYVRD